MFLTILKHHLCYVTDFGTPGSTSQASGLFGQTQQSTGGGGGLFSTPQTATAFGAKPGGFGGKSCYYNNDNLRFDMCLIPSCEYSKL
jgi:hypothetical protein